MNLKNMIMGAIGQDDLLKYYNASVIYEKMPKWINGFVFEYDCVFFIVINANISINKKRIALIHEIAHIELNQLEQNCKDLFAFYIDQYEDEASLYIKNIMDELNIKNIERK